LKAGCANPGLKVPKVKIFQVIFFTANAMFSMRLFKLKTEEQTIITKFLTAKLQN